jgi:Ca-activated chloride channel family protein
MEQGMSSNLLPVATPVSSNMKAKKAKSLDPGNLMLVVYTVAVALIIICGGLLEAKASEIPIEATESTAEQTDSFRLEDIRQGELLVPGQDGNAVSALQLEQEVQISISGVVARVRVSQQFQNSGADWVDGVYVFPLPDECAVDRLRMQVGEREIIGEIHEREEAQAIYTKAREEGRKTSLLAQNRPNIFTTRVANIGPGEHITIVIEYQQVVQMRDNVFSLRFPMAITPRYIPGKPIADGTIERRLLSFGNEGWARDTDRVPDASSITPPVAAPGSATTPTMQLSVDIVSGFPLSKLESLYHHMTTRELAKDHFSMEFTGKVLADRDLVLEWQPEKSGQTSAALLAETQGDNNYMLLMLMPPQERHHVYVPREAIFVLDVSGSMAGPSIVQAKEALRRALQKLRPSDRFNIVTFSSNAHALFPQSLPGTEENLAMAMSYLNSLQADGGTEMVPALELALDGRLQSERIRQVIFLTDGAIGNETELFELITQRLGDSRLFTVGIGSAPNGYFMTRAATMGRGTYTYIGDVNEIEQRVDELLSKLETPAVTDIRVKTTEGREVDFEAYPNPVPDLYYGEPLMLALKVDSKISEIIVSGKQLGKRWEYTVNTGTNSNRPGIGALWARKKIRSEMDSLALGEDPEAVKKIVLVTALEHQLVSKYTSLVAVDKVVSRPSDETSGKVVLKTAAPRGLQMNAVFGGGSRTATPSAMHMLAGSLLLLGAALLHIMRRRVWQR